MYTTQLKALNDGGSYIEDLENKAERLKKLEKLLRRVLLHFAGP